MRPKSVNWEKHILILGTMPDTHVGNITGVTGERVRQVRKKYGIPPFQGYYSHIRWDMYNKGKAKIIILPNGRCQIVPKKEM